MVRGDMRGAAAVWDALLDEYPRDLVALKVSQFVLSYLGESDRMRDRVARVYRRGAPDCPGYGFVLGCHAYALEESGDYRQAEDAGRRAVEHQPRRHLGGTRRRARGRDGRSPQRRDRLDLGARRPSGSDCSNFALHLKWHEGLYHLELEQHDRVLELYDREVRAESTDEYLDVANAVSLLWRLEQADVSVGSRWRELASRAPDARRRSRARVRRPALPHGAGRGRRRARRSASS